MTTRTAPMHPPKTPRHHGIDGVGNEDARGKETEMATTRVFSGRAARGLGRTRRVALLVAFFAMALLMWGLLFANAASPAWASTITVNNLADTTANDGECTLREAITSANTNTASGAALGECTAGSVTGSDVIDIGVTGTVNLTNVLPDLSSNLQIEGPGADQLTVRRDTGSDYRIFSVASGSVVSISGITITNGNVTTNNGGGILNFGTLTISDSTISANSARFGGGIANGQGILTITDSTISGNTAMFRGGGVRNADGLSVIEHSTITKNTAPSEGSGISSFGNTNTSTEVLSTIVSANTNTDVDLAPDIGTNSFDSNGYNLIGDGNATAAFNQTGDQIGVSDPKLGDLTNNGGPTNTHALLARSPAIDKGNTDLATDQRGAPRPFDDPSIAPAQGGDDSDIGSFEAQSVLNSATVATDDAYSTSEDTARTVDAPGVLDNDTDPDTGDTLEAVLVSGPSHAASFILNADGSFTYEPDDNFNGPDSFTYQANDGTDDSNTATVSITVKAVNDAPLATDDTRTINEDGAPSP
jgi:CSLREA domain-containing protein